MTMNANTVRDAVATAMAIQPVLTDVRISLNEAINKLSREAHGNVDATSEQGKALYLFMAHMDALQAHLKATPMVDCRKALRTLFDAGWLDSDEAQLRAVQTAERAATAARENLTGVLA